MNTEKHNINKQAAISPKKVSSPLFKDLDKENPVLAKYHPSAKKDKLPGKMTPMNKRIQPFSEMA